MRAFVNIGQEDPMATLCRMVVETRYEDLPENVIRCAKHSILDTIAVTVGGSAMDGIPAVVSLVKEKGGKPESYLPFYGGKVPASEAAFAIGPMARALDLGHVQKWAGHCSEYNVAALLAATGLRGRVSGKEFITAFALGQEVLIRIGVAYRMWSAVPIASIGGHYIFGPVAAVGKLLGLSFDELQNAQGIAREMTQPYSTAMYDDASLIVRVHHGFVCQDAINACLLVKRGITGPHREVLVGTKGYLSSAKWHTAPEELLEALGETWQMLTVQTKLYPSCRATHASIDGILDLMREESFQARDIARIDTEQSPRNWAVVCTPKEAKWNPQTVPECQFSMPYCVATAAYDGTVFLDSYTPQALVRAEVHELMARITAREDRALPEYGARLHVILKDGRRFDKEVSYPKGDPSNPFTEQELVEKFRRCVPYSAYKLGDAAVSNLVKAILHLETTEDIVQSLVLPLTPR